MLALWDLSKAPKSGILYGYKGRGNWYTLKLPAELRKLALTFVKNIIELDKYWYIDDIIWTDSKKFKNANILLSCKKTENRVYYRMLLYWHRNFICIDMNQYSWNVSLSYKLDEDIQCCNCTRYTDWTFDQWHEDSYEYSYYKCDDHAGRDKYSGTFEPTKEYRKLHNKCKKFVDENAKRIPIRKKIPTFETIEYQKFELYYLIRYIKAVYLKHRDTLFGNKIKHKQIPKKVRNSDEKIFLFIAAADINVIRMIINRI